MGEERFLSLKAVAEKEKLSLERLIDACARGELAAREFGGEWYISESTSLNLSELGQETAIDFHHLLFRPIGQLLLIVSVIFVAQSFWSADAGQYLLTGTSLTIGTASGVLDKLAAAPPLTVATVVFADVTRELTRLWLAAFDFWQTLAANLNYGWGKISDAWSRFFGRSPPLSATSETQPILDPALIAQLKAQIKEELTKELLNSKPAPAVGEKLPNTGLVVMPSTGDPVKDQALARELESSFSDQVEIKFGESGKTGVITPIFRAGRGEDYLFIITPINKSAP